MRSKRTHLSEMQRPPSKNKKARHHQHRSEAEDAYPEQGKQREENRGPLEESERMTNEGGK